MHGGAAGDGCASRCSHRDGSSQLHLFTGDPVHHVDRGIECVLVESVPEIAAEIKMPTNEVLWYLTGYKKYDIVIEEGMCGDYVLYKRVEDK